MKWVVRVWSLPTDQNGFRVLCEPPVIDASVTDRNDANGTGTIKVPADYDKLHLILRSDPTNLSQSASSVIAFHRVENDEPHAAGAGRRVLRRRSQLRIG